MLMGVITVGDGILIGQGVISLIQMGLQVFQMIEIKKLMDNMVNGQWLLAQARKWGVYFDKILLKYANLVYNYFVQILEGTLFTPELIDGIMNRLYIIVGLVIFFKLATLAIKYIASPEAFLDGKTGGEQLIKRILIGSVLIILMPMIFDIALNLQSAIISDNIIGKILLPEEVYKDYQQDKNNTGKKIGMMIVSGFFTWNDAIDPEASSDATKLKNQYDKVVKYNDLTYFDEEQINKTVPEKDGEYIISYVPIISTLAIGYYLVTLLKYAAEVVMRSFKLAFLQIIAPFSIVKWMLDPADTESLKKWINTTVSTYIMLFLRVLTVWIIAMMAYYLKNGVPTDSGVVSLISADTDEVLKALIIIGLFAFLKELPKLFTDLFGYNLAENETIAGVANQAVGVVKGLALGKVGMAQQEKIMNLGLWSSGFGAAGAAAGAASKSMSNVSGGKGVKATVGITHGLGNFGIGVNNAMGGAWSNAISSNFGSSPVGVFGKGASAFNSSSYQYDDRADYSQFKKKSDEEKKQKKNAKEATNIFNNVCHARNDNKNEINLQNQQQREAFFQGIEKSFQERYKGQEGATVPTRQDIVATVNSINNINPAAVTQEQMVAIYSQLDSQVSGGIDAAATEKANAEAAVAADQLATFNATMNYTPPTSPEPQVAPQAQAPTAQPQQEQPRTEQLNTGVSRGDNQLPRNQ